MINLLLAETISWPEAFAVVGIAFAAALAFWALFKYGD